MFIVVPNPSRGMIPWSDAIVADSLTTLQSMRDRGRFRRWLAPELFEIQGDRMVKILDSEVLKKYVYEKRD